MRIISYIFCIWVLLLSGSIKTQGIPAYPHIIKVKSCTGELVEIYLCGDEHFRYGISTDGYTLVQKPSGWFYATKNDTTDFAASHFALMPYEKETDSLQTFKSTLPKGMLPSKSYIANRRRSKGLNVQRSSSQSIAKGECRSLVILMQFRDTPMTFGNEDFVRLFNEVDYKEDGAVGSVRDYFNFASDGQLDFVTDIYGPYTTQNDMAYYGANINNQDMNPLKMVIEAIESLPEDIDLSVYDNNADGCVDNVHIIFSGYGEEAGASSNAIWSHEYPRALPIKLHGLRFAGYSCSPELRNNNGKKISRIGPPCHELCHALGAKDYYDTDYEDGGMYDGTGDWDLMGGGSWNGEGTSPAKPNPYVRAYDFGWTPVTKLTKAGNYILSSDSIALIETGDSGDYYLLENRRMESFDSSLPNSGLVIYHHHPNMETLAERNGINASHPQGFYPVCASSTLKTPISSRNYGNINAEGCAYPTCSNNEFSSTSTPSAFAWSGSDVAFSVSNIRLSDNLISYNFNIDGEITEGNEPIDVLNFYTESFESGISRFTPVQIYGNTTWKVYPGEFVQEPNLIPNAYEGKHLLQLFTGYKGKQVVSELTSPTLSLSPDSIYTFSCYYRNCCAPNSIAPQLTLSLKVNDDEMTDVITTDEEIDEWTKLTLEIPAGTRSLQYCFKGKVYTGGLFIDYVQLQGEPEAAGVETIIREKNLSVSVTENIVVLTSKKPTQCSIFSIAGILMCHYLGINTEPTIKVLPKGVYLIRTATGEQQRFIIP